MGKAVAISNYTIPKIKRELKPYSHFPLPPHNYTIPKIKRELKQMKTTNELMANYTIPKIKRELKQHRRRTNRNEIIPYQKLKGN